MRKRILAFILSITLFTGCSETKESNVVPDTVNSKSDNTVKTSDSNKKNTENLKDDSTGILKFDEYFSYVSDVVQSGENIYVLGDNKAKTSQEFFVYNVESKKKTEKNIDLSFESLLFNLFDDKLCVVYKNDESNYNIKVADIKSEEVYDFSVDELYISEVLASGDKVFYTPASRDKFCIVDMATREKSEYTLPSSFNEFSGIKFTVDKDGYIYFFCSDMSGNKILYKFDSDLNELYSNDNFVDMGGSTIHLSSNKEGNLIVATFDQDMTYINIVDSKTGETVERYELQNVYGIFAEYMGYDIAYSSSNSLYGYNFDTQTEELICSDILSEEEFMMGVTSENNILLCKDIYKPAEKKIVMFDINGNAVDEIPLIKNNDGSVRNLFVDKSGNIYYLEEAHSPEFYSEYEEDIPYVVHTITSEGSHSFFEIPVYNELRYSLFIKADTSGNILIGEEDDGIMYLTSYDKNGNKNGELELTDCVSFHSVAVSGDTIVINYATYGEIDKGIAVKQSDKKISIVHEYSSEFFGKLISGNDEHDIFIRDGSTIYGFDIEENKKIRVIDLISNNISPTDIFADYLCGDKFYFLTSDGWKTVGINEVQSDKTIINLSGVGMSYIDNVEEAVMQFNSTNDEYQIVCTDYSGDSQSKEQFNLDVVMGKVDIVLFCSGFEMSSYDYNKGIFADLNPFIDNDPEINRNDFFTNVLDMYSENGKLYEIVPEFSIETLQTTHKEYADKENWNIGEYSDFVSEHSDKKMLKSQRMYVIDKFLSACVYDFVDADNNKCNFTDDDFKKMLVFLRNGLNNTFDIDNLDEESYFYRGDILSQDINGNKLYFKGFPSNTKNGVIFSPDISFAIMSNSDNKDGAWEFIRTFLLDDYQKKVIEEKLPLKVSVLKDYIKKHTDDTDITDEELDVYKNRVLRADCKDISGSRLSKIIREEADLYFADEVTLDEAVQAIQSKVTLYLNES